VKEKSIQCAVSVRPLARTGFRWEDNIKIDFK
jgi:hypothetical protein